MKSTIYEMYFISKKNIYIYIPVGTSAIFQQQDHLRSGGGETQRNHCIAGKCRVSLNRTTCNRNAQWLSLSMPGVIYIQDEECLLPGEATDLTFLEKMEEKIGGHPHFVTSVTHHCSGEHVRAEIEIMIKISRKKLCLLSPTAISLQTKRPEKHWIEETSASCTMLERSPTVLWVRH